MRSAAATTCAATVSAKIAGEAAVLVEHDGRRPSVDPSAWVAPTAVLSGDVRVGGECRVLFGAVLTDEGGPIELADHVIVMENALIRGRRHHPVRVGLTVSI